MADEMHQTSSRYIPAIDGMRAIAVLAVIVFHADFLDALPSGFTGVDMFFVLSGYVVSQSLWDRRELGVVHFLKDFYRRRLLRILPALLVVLSVSFVVSALFMPQFWLSELINRTGLAAYFGLSNVVLAWNTDTYFSPSAELNPYLHTWSLGVEEQFYVIFPIMYFIWLRFNQQVALVKAVLPLLALVSLVLSAVETPTDPRSAFYLLPSRFWEFAAGAMLFQSIGTRRFSARVKIRIRWLLPSGLGLIILGFVCAERDQFPFPWALVTVLGTLLMLTPVVIDCDNAPSALLRALQARLIVYVGRLSYSLYLWHWPVAGFLRWTTGMELLAVQLAYPLIVFAFAAASYHWIETPIRRSRSLLQRGVWVVAASTLLATSVLWIGALWISNHPGQLSLSQTRDAYEWYAYKHFPRGGVKAVEDPSVQGRQLFVIGDSHTAAYRTLLNLARLQLGITVVEYEQGGCGVVTLIGPDPASCAKRREADLEDIEARAKPGDIVFLASLRMPELYGRNGARDEAHVYLDALSQLTPLKLERAKASAEAVLTRLTAARVRVLIDAPKPVFKAPANRCSDWFNRMNPVCAGGLTIERKQLERLREPQMKLLNVLKREFPALSVWDPFPILCPTQTCSAFDRQGKPLFFDSNHLSGHGNRVLAPSFITRVQKLLKSE